MNKELHPADLPFAQDKILFVDRQNYRITLFTRQPTSTVFDVALHEPVALGAAGYETPSGIFLLRRRAKDPDWYIPDSKWVDQAFREKYKDSNYIVPAGDPNNPIVAAFLDIYGGVGIHGTVNLASLGTAASHGCIRVKPKVALELFRRVPVGTPVVIDYPLVGNTGTV